MIIPFEIPDKEILSIARMPNIGQILDKTYKNSRAKMIREVAHDRQIIIAFNLWYGFKNDEERELIMKNIKSTIPIDEIVDKDVQDRELIIEAIQRIRANQTLNSEENA
jgi:hypothetical protein